MLAVGESDRHESHVNGRCIVKIREICTLNRHNTGNAKLKHDTLCHVKVLYV